MAALNPLGGERLERAEVLREAHRADDLGEFAGAVDAQDLVGELDGGVQLDRAAHGADLHRDFKLADQVLAVDIPDGHRAVLAVAGAIDVRAGFDRAPVVAGGDAYRADAVHHTLIMGGSAVRVALGEWAGGFDP